MPPMSPYVPYAHGRRSRPRAGLLRHDAAVHPVAVLAGVAVGAGLLTWFASGRSKRSAPSRGGADTAGAARRLNHASSMLAASVLLDSGLEHYRGQFFNRAMVTPIVVSSITLASSLHGAGDTDPGSSRVRHGVQALAGLTGLIGFGFHVYNVGKREGGYALQNLFYAAPIGAPMALTLAGLLGVAAERVRDADPEAPALMGLPAGKTLAVAAAGMLLGTTGEAGLLQLAEAGRVLQATPQAEAHTDGTEPSERPDDEDEYGGASDDDQVVNDAESELSGVQLLKAELGGVVLEEIDET